MPSQRSNVDPLLGPLKPGDQFEKYQIRRLLGRGGHAFVYEAHHTFLDRLVAIKVIPNPGNHRENLQRRAQSEARVLSKLDHPKLVRVLDAGALGGDLVYIVMELLRGRTLREAYRELGKLTPAEVLAVGAQIAQGIEAAHAEKTIHRDLKPENVFVEEGNEIKVLDFGIAKFLDQVGHTTQRDILQGTLLYMAPEHLRALGVTPRSDIFALGTILYEGLTGRPPALISAARLGIEKLGLRQLSDIQISEPPPDLEELIPGLPRHVARVVHKMIAKQPSDRHGSMREVSEALLHGSRRLLEGSGGRSDLRPLWKASGLGLSPQAPNPDSEPQPGPPFTPPPPAADALAKNEALPRIPSAPFDTPTRTAPFPASDPTPPPSTTTGRHAVHRSKLRRTVALAVSSGAVVGLALAVWSSRAGRDPEHAAAQAPAPSATIVPTAPVMFTVAPPPVASASAPPAPSASASAPRPKNTPAKKAPLLSAASAGASSRPKPIEKQDELPGSGFDDPRRPWIE